MSDNKIVKLASKIIVRGHELRERYNEELEKWEFTMEMARISQEQAEKVALTAQIVDGRRLGGNGNLPRRYEN